MTGRQLAAHVPQLADDLGTYLDVRRTRLPYPRGESIAMFREARVWIPLWDQPSYLTALHELGHIAHGHSRLWADRQQVLVQEAEAWVWAFDRMAEPNTPEGKWFALHWCYSSDLDECARSWDDVPGIALTMASNLGMSFQLLDA